MQFYGGPCDGLILDVKEDTNRVRFPGIRGHATWMEPKEYDWYVVEYQRVGDRMVYVQTTHEAPSTG